MNRALRRHLPTLVVVSLAAALVVVAAVGREVSRGRAEAAAAEDAAARGEWPSAILHARAAAEAYVPGARWPEDGLRRLADIGDAARGRGDRETARLAYGAMLTAAVAGSPWTGAPWTGASGQDWRARAERGLAATEEQPAR